MPGASLHALRRDDRMMRLHPTPQFRREQWCDLNGTWGFAYDDGNVGLDAGWQADPRPFSRTIEVPFPPESPASGIADRDEHPVVWYRRTFRLGDVAGYRQGRRLILHFGAVDYDARVWVNGQFVGGHRGGHSSFAMDITTAVGGGDEQTIVVRAEDQPQDLSQPRGKQSWETPPRRIWYHRTTGIWQPVWLEAVGAVHISEVRWTPDTRAGRLGMEVRLNEDPPAGSRVRLRLTLASDVLADDSYLVQRRDSRRDVGLEPGSNNAVRRKLLWTPNHPNLVDADLILEDADGSVLDAVQSYVGLRSVEAADELFLVNGRPSYLRLVLSQGYWPESHLAAPSEDALRREVEIIKSLGFNGVRIHQKVEDPRFLYWCDRLGLFVWSEMASAYAFNQPAVSRFTAEWLEVVQRDYSHPSIVTWVPFNESWGVPNLPGERAQRDYVRGIYHMTKALDPTRPVIGNDGWEHFVGDIWGIHDYGLDGAVLRERYGSRTATEATLAGRPQHHRAVLEELPRSGRPVVLSEFGGISFAPQRGTPWYGYGHVSDEAQFAAKYTELVDAILDSDAIAGFCYTQLADTEQETNGLLRADRTPKIDPELVARVTRRPSRAIPGDFVSQVQQAGIVTAFGQAAG